MTVAGWPMRHRLSRLDHVYPDKLVYFITFCTHARQPSLANSTLHESFRTFGFKAESRYILVGRYVIMPDHVHFFVTLRDLNACRLGSNR